MSRGRVALDQEWVVLQQKIFSRWVKQKLQKKQIHVEDVVKDISDGTLLVSLIEVLSESTYPGKPLKPTNSRVQKIDNVNNALSFVWSKGVEMKAKPQAEGLVDGDVTAVLGLIWSIMLRYIKIGDDDEEKLNAKDALLLWAQNKTAGYPNVNITNFKSSFKDGFALCALIHKHRPTLIDWDSLSTSTPKENLEKAINAAHRYFHLEKYLTPEDITKLDENSMVVYVSEYYYGIAEQRRIDLAAKRISKVIQLTLENDAMKDQFNKTAASFKERLTRVEKILEDRTIENTMSGAKRRIQEFYDYKTKDKNVLLGEQLGLEGLYNNLAMRLAHNKRPDFVPPSGLTLKDVSASLLHLEECEQERRVALHAELNRQIRLLRTDEQHEQKHQKLTAWLTEKEAYLKTKEEIDTVSKAHLQLRLLDAYDKESAALQSSRVIQWQKQADELVGHKYERSDEVTSRVATAKDHFVTLGELSAAKRPVLQDDLARETFKENLRLKDEQHHGIYSQLLTWVQEKEAYLKTKEEIHSVKEAQEHLSLLDGYDQEKQGVTDSSVAYLKNLGAEIIAAKYHTSYSSHVFEKPEELHHRETDIDNKWQALSELSAEKRRVLDDDLARESFADAVRALDRNHTDKYNKLNAWVTEKKEYLHRKEHVDSIGEAHLQLSLLEAYHAEKSNRAAANVKALKTLGAEILAKKHQSKYSEWVYETPDKLNAREGEIDAHWEELGKLYEAKKKVLEDDLARELEKERLRIEFAHLASDFVGWTKDIAEDLAATHFGFSLPEVEEYKASLDAENSAIEAEADRKKAAYEEIFKQGADLGVTENVYTQLTLDDLANARHSLNESLASRNDAYAKELAKQQANDALCQKFAQHVEPLSKWIVQQKDTITQSKQSLEDQLQYVESRLASVGTDGAPLKDIQALEEQIEAEGITNNRHTNLSFKDVQVQFEQYTQFLESKKKMLDDAIQQEKLKGITASELKEIEENFRQFDAGAKGHLDKKELKACLYSLGEEKTRTELDEIVKRYGSEAGVTYEGFKEYMIAVLGVSDTKEDILNGFVAINRADNPGKFEEFGMVLNDHDLDYIKRTAPALDGGFDFRAWTDEIFAR